MNNNLETPVLFLVFNRPNHTKQVFEAIKSVKPTRLYIASDGSRLNRDGEANKVEETRKYVTNNVDWDCEVKTLFREENLGCRYAVSGAIDWFFQHESMGIILEDDCLPTQSFFWFCRELLTKYEHDKRIWDIAGTNFHGGWVRDKDYSYYYSFYGSIWGWATWRDRWSAYDVDIKSYQEIKQKKYLWDVFGNKRESRFRQKHLEKIFKGHDTWDFQWDYTKFINSGLSIVPTKNLVKNIGFGKDATHTFSMIDPSSNMRNYELDFPLKEPPFLIRDRVSDDRYFRLFLSVITKRITKIRFILNGRKY